MTKKTAFDLASLDTVKACNKPFELQIKDVHGKPTEFFISVLGRDSDVFTKLTADKHDEMTKRRALGEEVVAETYGQSQKSSVDFLAALSVSWRVGDSPTVSLDGEELEFSPENARKVYARITPVRTQVDQAILKIENFMPAS